MKTIFFCCNLLSSSVTVIKLVTSLISLEDGVQMGSGSISYKGAKELFWIVLGIPHVVMLVLYSLIPLGEKKRWWLTVLGQYYVSGAITNLFFLFSSPFLSPHIIFSFSAAAQGFIARCFCLFIKWATNNHQWFGHGFNFCITNWCWYSVGFNVGIWEPDRRCWDWRVIFFVFVCPCLKRAGFKF